MAARRRTSRDRGDPGSDGARLRVTLYAVSADGYPGGERAARPLYRRGGQPAYPWRGRITCDPAPGEPGTATRPARAATQVDAFFGDGGRADFSVAGRDGDLYGPRRMVASAASCCIMRIFAKPPAASMPSSSARRCAASAGSRQRQHLPFRRHADRAGGRGEAACCARHKMTYAADWSEYFGHQPQDGSGDVYFHLDPLWARREYRRGRHRHLLAAVGLARRHRASRLPGGHALHPRSRLSAGQYRGRRGLRLVLSGQGRPAELAERSPDADAHHGRRVWQALGFR